MNISCTTRFELIDLHPAQADVVAAVHQGLERRPRQLPAWLLYDQKGSELFDAITRQPEYSLTRTEQALLTDKSSEMATNLPAVWWPFLSPRGLAMPVPCGSGCIQAVW